MMSDVIRSELVSEAATFIFRLWKALEFTICKELPFKKTEKR